MSSSDSSHPSRYGNLLRQVSVLAGGTAGAQIVLLAVTPFLTRIYGPEAFGALGAILAITAIISPVVAGTYPTAIVLVSNTEDAAGLARASVAIAGVSTVTVAVVVLTFRNRLAELVGLAEYGHLLILVPLLLITSAFIQIYRQWNLREFRFGVVARTTVWHAILTNAAQVAGGFMRPVAGTLVVLAVAGQFVHALLLSLRSRKIGFSFRRWDPRRLARLVSDYRDFPLYRAPQQLLNGVSTNVPVLVLTTFVSPAAGGLFVLARRVLSAPSALVGKSVADAVYPRLSRLRQDGKALGGTIDRATLGLFGAGGPLCLLIIVWGPSLFAWAFGGEWFEAGQYARWLVIWLLFSLANRPSVAAIPVLDLQGKYLWYEMASLALRLVSLVLPLLWNFGDIVAIAAFSCVSALCNLFLVAWVRANVFRSDRR